MIINQHLKLKNQPWKNIGDQKTLNNPLVLAFGNRLLLESPTVFEEVHAMYPDAHIVLGSTSGDIMDDNVNDESISITAIEFEKSHFSIKTANVLNEQKDSFKTGKHLIEQFDANGLKHVFIISEGSFINGTQLTLGMNSVHGDDLLITGGLCADDARFEKTICGYNCNPKAGEIVAIGFYGESFEATFSIHGGWIPFGPERIVTKSKGNILYELDDMPALDLYKKYLGEKSKELPGAALLYPLNVKIESQNQSIVRSILNIEEDDNAMVLAGDIPENSKVQLMMTNVDQIANAAEKAARQADDVRSNTSQLALLVSCIGRKLVLDQRVEEEIEEVRNVLGDDVVISGFYSYGEIAPFHKEMKCQLHNQTMTITLLSE
ncbi:FIST C-terminal domain-containing protein [Nonlabens mediterrranea]|uniref:FIST C-terminal domain-containing protein n=2 Tax=Nonlabens mediterrranea TaxID=1419947 RepID=A0ABS0A5M9_9FLAO|nr:FIST C-terminal domain-containing protein [Nonlabens mediterrranea]